MFNWNKKRRVLTIRVDHESIPEFWLEIEVPMEKATAYMKKEEDELEESEDEDHRKKEEEKDGVEKDHGEETLGEANVKA